MAGTAAGSLVPAGPPPAGVGWRSAGTDSPQGLSVPGLTSPRVLPPLGGGDRREPGGCHVEPLLFFGRVMHARLRPARNVFSYRVFFVRFPISSIGSLGGALLSVDRFNLFSIHTRDHGPRDGGALEPWIRQLLAREGIRSVDGEIWLQCFPRVLGYVFNPVSFWLCLDRDDRLRAVLCEVSNTFGETHNYLLAHADERPIEPGDTLTARKVFHVSPFCAVDGGYRFRFEIDPDATLMRIDHDDPGGKLLLTSVSGRGETLTTRSLLRAFLTYPALTFMVIGRIHWQALRLWWKGVPFFSKPVPPTRETTR